MSKKIPSQDLVSKYEQIANVNFEDTLCDIQIWERYPKYRWIHNKLELAIRCGYNAGPIGSVVTSPGYYCVRPIYNLFGLGINAKKVWLEQKMKCIENYHPSEFWCEWFDESHYSIDYIWNDGWQPIFATQGFNDDEDLIHFNYWKKISPPNKKLPSFLDDLQDMEYINIEFKGDNIIEVHLRLGNLHGDWYKLHDANILVPAWKSKYEEEAATREQQGWRFVSDVNHDFNNIKDHRLGFWYC